MWTQWQKPRRTDAYATWLDSKIVSLGLSIYRRNTMIICLHGYVLLYTLLIVKTLELELMENVMVWIRFALNI